MGNHNHYKDSDFERGNIGDVFGLEEALREIEEKGEEVQQAYMKAVKNGADEMVALLKAACPVKTGNLRDSITKKSKAGGAYYTITANAKDEEGFLYAGIVEFSPTRGHPFFYPTFDANIDNINNEIDAAINNSTKES